MNPFLKNQSAHLGNHLQARSSWALAACCLALVMLGAFAASAATLIVTNTADSGPGSLRTAIGAAANGDTITFAIPSPSTIRLTSDGLTINNSVTIVGPGAANLAISGNGANQVFGISGSRFLNISGVTITNGTTGINIVGPGAALAMNNVVVTGNNARGIYANTATLQVVNCSISGNTNLSDGFGGGIYITCFESVFRLSMTNTVVSGNVATNGGGIYLNPTVGDSYVFSFSNVLVSSNRAFGSGGGFYNYAGAITLSNLTLSGNVASGGGGGIYNYVGDSLTLRNVNLIGNTSGYGGGICNDGFTSGADLQIFNSTISSNSAGPGGGIYSNGHESRATVEVFNSTFSHNSANGPGGGIYSEGTGGEGSVTIVGSTFNGNAAVNGGGVYNNAGEFNGDNGSTSLGVTNSTFSGNSAGFGGAIYNLSSAPVPPPINGGASATVQMFNSTFTGNSGTNGGGILYNTNYGIGSAPVQIGSTILNAGPLGGTLLAPVDTVTSSGYNLSSDNAGGAFTNGTDLINTDPKLGPLQDNGGAVFTHALLSGSPAIDQGYNFSGLANDGRGLGFVRTYDYPAIANAAGGDGTDIGAFELQPPTTDFATWQLQYFGSSSSPQAAPTADPDGDGANNMSEFLAGTNPRNSASVFRVLGVTRQGNDLLVTWQTAGGHTNVLQSSATLAIGSFIDSSPQILIQGTGDATNSYLESGAALNGTNSFYRVRLAQ